MKNKQEILRKEIDDVLSIFSNNSFQEALDSIEAIKEEYPNEAILFNIQGACYAGLGHINKAIENYKKAIALNSGYSKAHFNLAGALHEIDQFDTSIKSYKDALIIEPDYAEAHNNLGNVYREVMKVDEAIMSYQKAISIKPDYIEAHYSLGSLFHECGKLEEAVTSFREVLQIRPNFTGMHNNLGNIYKELKDFDSAIKSYLKAINIKPDYAEAYNNIGMLYGELGRLDQAIISYERAVNIMPNYAEAHNNLGILLMEDGQFDLAEQSYRKAIDADNNFIEAHNNLGLVFLHLGQLDKSIYYYQKAIKIDPNYVLALNNLGIVYKNLNNFDEAVKCFDRAIIINPNYFDAFSNYGNLLRDFRIFDEALSNYKRAYELNPTSDYSLGNLLHTKMHLCVWEDFSTQINKLQVKINDGQNMIDPFAFMALNDDPELQQKVSITYTEDKYPNSYLLPDINYYSKHNKIRIGYFSGDFREHPVSTLTVGLFELHDRSQFEIYAFSYGYDTQDEMNLRIKAGVDHFYDVQTMSHKEIVLLSRSNEIDIAVDLGGLTAGARTNIFAMIVAPIQLSYIGFLGTMGTSYYSYLLADHVIIPEETQQFYSEKIAYLPSYQVNDSKELSPEIYLTRKDIGLPEDGFVFCCFNNNYKITPTTFDSWMRILEYVEDGVLLIYVDVESAKRNLINEATLRGIDPNRLFFAEHFDRERYLARYRVADLFLDTLPYNAATTASDALRMGLPVLTCKGKSFASRVAASVINAVNLPELITNNQKEYEALAIELATNPEKFKSIKEKLKDNLSTSPLYDTQKFTENLESIYKVMYERHHDGLEPEHIYIKH
jgi:protein O-GlcNAc transferase